ncbi:hypothetical protein G9463_17595 [Haloarcula sp. JP-Z28]|uniref:hypothetical protein n=1 Tax=Haloarcula sp. JP-Z28 TaxID=2716715 RepID=UPI0014048391|nr:hypothetical protein [Haloarcula sp. JP-Z28]NHN65101.1 hypothetical protein [Haloarcula sp. JP-Z28]
MTRTKSPPVDRPEQNLNTVLVLSFEQDANDQPRRIRYLACPGKETMWRVDERRCGVGWQTIDTEPIENLQLSQPDQTPKTERQTDVGV